jgi:hypothetical protein
MKLRYFAICSVLLWVPLSGCGSSSKSSSSPTPPVATLPPAPAPTPVPTPTPDPFTATCVPTPPPIHGMKLKAHVDQGYRKLLDSKPIVKNIDGYCAKVGFSASGPYCDTRPEGDVLREACDALAVGKAKDTGRYGPTWSFNDEPCAAPGAIATEGCVNHGENQFLVIAKGPGTYLACPAEGPCGSYEVEDTPPTPTPTPTPTPMPTPTPRN